MQRYQSLSLKIDSFRLCSCGSYDWRHSLIVSSHNWIVGAIKMGATAIRLEHYNFTLPQEVFRSESLLKLCLISCKVEVNYVISCSRLKSLTLEHAKISDDVFKDLISCCILMEELSLSNCYNIALERMTPFELHKLKCLFLHMVDVGSIFSSNFSSRFPCLKDLSILECDGCTNIRIASTSLETICFKTDKVSEGAKFDVPNIRKFTYSCFGLPSHLSIDGASKEWEFDLSTASNRFHKISWFTNLKKLLKKFRLSRISLCVSVNFARRHWSSKSDLEHEVDVEVVPKPLVVENLMIEAPPTLYSALMVRSLGAFRPKFITHSGCISYAWMLDREKSIDTPYERVLQLVFIPNWQEKFGHFGLKKVNVEICEEFDTTWQPPHLKKPVADSEATVRLQLIWED